MLYFLAVSMLVTVLGVLADGSSSSSTGSQFLHDRPGPDLNPLSSSTDGSTSEVLTAVEAGPPFSGSGTQRSSQTSTKDITVTVKSTTIVESTRTAVMTTPPTRATSHSTSAPATQPPGLPMCWTIGGCAPVVDDLTAAYAFSGQLIDPNDRGQNPARDPNRLFQMNFCQNSNYKESVCTISSRRNALTPRKCHIRRYRRYKHTHVRLCAMLQIKQHRHRHSFHTDHEFPMESPRLLSY
jgi:hypothetical protein